MSLQPAFGYIRINRAGSSADMDALQTRMRAQAEERGYLLSQIFIETEDGTSSAYAALIDEARDGGIEIVLVPSMEHFGHLASLSTAMRRRVEEEAGVQVVALPEELRQS